MKKSKNAYAGPGAEQQKMLGPNLSFAGTEAYKLLRTNVALTLPKKEGCRLLGVTSTFAAEGKSTTSVNLAYEMAQDGRSVLLLEGDMRRPSVATRLGLPITPGLSNLLVGQCTVNEAVQKSPLCDNFYVLTAGDLPPNPSELLNSEQMELAVASLAKAFDYIIFDLPPVSAVADALIITKLVHSVIIVVRRGYCRRQALQKTLRQMELVQAKVLGVVMTHGEVHSKDYKKYGYYSGYYTSRREGTQ